jgi:hypothetical protein
MDKVWIIEQGSYSDYRVVGIFSTEQKAQQVCDWINSRQTYGDKAEVTWRCLDPAIELLNSGLSQWRVQMLRDGSTERVEQQDDTYDLEGSAHIWDRPRAPFYAGKGGVQAALVAKVWARDSDHAIKIANERRVQMIASGEWPEPPK